MRCTAIILTLAMFTTEACRAQEPAPSPQPQQPVETLRAAVQSDGSSTVAAVPAPAPAKGGAGTSSTPPGPARRGGGGFGSQNSYNPITIDGDNPNNNTWLMLKRPPTSRPTEKGAYLGLSVSSVPTVLRDQLKLQRNVGLVVNFVEKDSPAEAAGFKQSDVLQKLDDQILIDSRQFAVLVRMHDVNQPVRFTIIREAKPMEVVAKLQQRDLTVLDDNSMKLDAPFEKYLDLQTESRARDADSRADEAAARAQEAVNRAMEQLNRRMELKGRAFGFESKDDKHMFSISEADGHRKLVAYDETGKKLFEGPIDTDEQVELLPVDIREKVKALPVWWPGKGPLATQPFKFVAPKAPKAPKAPIAPPAPPAPPAPAAPKAPVSSILAADQQKGY